MVKYDEPNWLALLPLNPKNSNISRENIDGFFEHVVDIINRARSCRNSMLLAKSLDSLLPLFTSKIFPSAECASKLVYLLMDYLLDPEQSITEQEREALTKQLQLLLNRRPYLPLELDFRPLLDYFYACAFSGTFIWCTSESTMSATFYMLKSCAPYFRPESIPYLLETAQRRISRNNTSLFTGLLILAAFVPKEFNPYVLEKYQARGGKNPFVDYAKYYQLILDQVAEVSSFHRHSTIDTLVFLCFKRFSSQPELVQRLNWSKHASRFFVLLIKTCNLPQNVIMDEDSKVGEDLGSYFDPPDIFNILYPEDSNDKMSYASNTIVKLMDTHKAYYDNTINFFKLITPYFNPNIVQELTWGEAICIFIHTFVSHMFLRQKSKSEKIQSYRAELLAPVLTPLPDEIFNNTVDIIAELAQAALHSSAMVSLAPNVLPVVSLARPEIVPAIFDVCVSHIRSNSVDFLETGIVTLAKMAPRVLELQGLGVVYTFDGQGSMSIKSASTEANPLDVMPLTILVDSLDAIISILSLNDAVRLKVIIDLFSVILANIPLFQEVTLTEEAEPKEVFPFWTAKPEWTLNKSYEFTLNSTLNHFQEQIYSMCDTFLDLFYSATPDISSLDVSNTSVENRSFFTDIQPWNIFVESLLGAMDTEFAQNLTELVFRRTQTTPRTAWPEIRNMVEVAIALDKEFAKKVWLPNLLSREFGSDIDRAWVMFIMTIMPPITGYTDAFMTWMDKNIDSVINPLPETPLLTYQCKISAFLAGISWLTCVSEQETRRVPEKVWNSKFYHQQWITTLAWKWYDFGPLDIIFEEKDYHLLELLADKYLKKMVMGLEFKSGDPSDVLFFKGLLASVLAPICCRLRHASINLGFEFSDATSLFKSTATHVTEDPNFNPVVDPFFVTGFFKGDEKYASLGIADTRTFDTSYNFNPDNIADYLFAEKAQMEQFDLMISGSKAKNLVDILTYKLIKAIPLAQSYQKVQTRLYLALAKPVINPAGYEKIDINSWDSFNFSLGQFSLGQLYTHRMGVIKKVVDMISYLHTESSTGNVITSAAFNSMVALCKAIVFTPFVNSAFLAFQGVISGPYAQLFAFTLLRCSKAAFKHWSEDPLIMNGEDAIPSTLTSSMKQLMNYTFILPLTSVARIDFNAYSGIFESVFDLVYGSKNNRVKNLANDEFWGIAVSDVPPLFIRFNVDAEPAYRNVVCIENPPVIYKLSDEQIKSFNERVNHSKDSATKFVARMANIVSSNPDPALVDPIFKLLSPIIASSDIGLHREIVDAMLNALNTQHRLYRQKILLQPIIFFLLLASKRYKRIMGAPESWPCGPLSPQKYRTILELASQSRDNHVPTSIVFPSWGQDHTKNNAFGCKELNLYDRDPIYTSEYYPNKPYAELKVPADVIFSTLTHWDTSVSSVYSDDFSSFPKNKYSADEFLGKLAEIDVRDILSSFFTDEVEYALDPNKAAFWKLYIRDLGQPACDLILNILSTFMQQEEPACHVLCVEMIAGMLKASKYISPNEAIHNFAAIIEYLSQIFLTQSSATSMIYEEMHSVGALSSSDSLFPFFRMIFESEGIIHQAFNTELSLTVRNRFLTFCTAACLYAPVEALDCSLLVKTLTDAKTYQNIPPLHKEDICKLLHHFTASVYESVYLNSIKKEPCPISPTFNEIFDFFLSSEDKNVSSAFLTLISMKISKGCSLELHEKIVSIFNICTKILDNGENVKNAKEIVISLARATYSQEHFNELVGAALKKIPVSSWLAQETILKMLTNLTVHHAPYWINNDVSKYLSKIVHSDLSDNATIYLVELLSILYRIESASCNNMTDITAAAYLLAKPNELSQISKSSIMYLLEQNSDISRHALNEFWSVHSDPEELINFLGHNTYEKLMCRIINLEHFL